MMDAEVIELFASSVRRAVRQPTAAEVDLALADIGWREALATEAASVVPVLFSEQGEANSTSCALDDVLAEALGRLGEPDVAVVLPALGSVAAPGRLDGQELSVSGLSTARMLAASSALVVAADTAGQARLAIVGTGSLVTTGIGGVDPALGLLRVDGAAPLDAECAEPVEWPAAVAAGQLALTYELLGATRAMLRLAREHAVTRIQAGRPISVFQAVRHRLADTLVAVESSAALAAAASDSIGTTLGTELAGIAKGYVGRMAAVAARHCQQVLAGIGFTAEHQFQAYYRRVLVLDQLLGSSRMLTRTLGERLLEGRLLPDMPAL
jgi:hypothetical protein